MIKSGKILAIILVVLIIPLVSNAWTLKEALDQAATYFKTSGKISQKDKIVITGVVNYHSKKRDSLGEKIETELYFAIERKFPEVKLVDISESLAGVSLKSKIVLKGSYEQKGDSTILRLQTLKGVMSGEILTQSTFEFETGRVTEKALVAVLDLEAKTMDEEQRKAFSDILRSALGNIGRFEIVSSAEIDKRNPDEIQKQTGCTRDSCAVIIGQQLGVDRVISSSFRKVSDGMYILAAKMMDIEDGSIVTSKTVTHTGQLQTLETSLNSLAQLLVGSTASKSVEFISTATPDTGPTKTGIERVTPKVTGDRKATVAALFLESIPSEAEVYLGEFKSGTTPYQNFQLKPGQKIQITLKKQDYHDKVLELTLSGGVNEIEIVKMMPKFGRFKVTSQPSGAEVWLAGGKVGTTPYEDDKLTSGKYLISLRMPLYLAVENEPIEINDGKSTVKNFILEPSFGRVIIETEQKGVRVTVFGKEGQVEKKAISPAALRLSPGGYKLELSKQGYDTVVFNIDIARSQDLVIDKKESILRRLEGTLILSTEPYKKGAEVFIGGKQVGRVPTTITLPIGSYEVEIVSMGLVGSARVKIEDQKTMVKTIKLEERVSEHIAFDSSSGLMWQDNSSEKLLSWEAAKYFCNYLVLDGESNWRLPKIEELISLSKKISMLRSNESFRYWSSTPHQFLKHYAQIFDFRWNRDSSIEKSKNCYVRCVKSGKTGRSNSKTLPPSRNVTIDKATGLMWQDNDYTAGHILKSAINFCSSLNLSGYSDWRLPNRYELIRLYEHRKILKSYKSGFYWSSTTDLSIKGRAWHVSFSSGSVYYYSKSNNFYVRCVRGGQ